MRWLGTIVDRDDEFTPFLTAHLPIPAVALRRTTLALVLIGFGIALGVVLHHDEQVQLAGVTAIEVLVYLPLIDVPTRRLHRYSRVGANFALLHLLSTLALIAWSWLLPLADRGPQADLRRAIVFAGLRGDPHPTSTSVGAYRAVAWTCGALAVLGGIALHVQIQRLGRTLAGTSDPDSSA